MRTRPGRWFWRGAVAWRRLSPRRGFRGRSVLCPENWTLALGLSRGNDLAPGGMKSGSFLPRMMTGGRQVSIRSGIVCDSILREDTKDGVGLADERSTAEWRWVGWEGWSTSNLQASNLWASRRRLPDRSRVSTQCQQAPSRHAFWSRRRRRNRCWLFRCEDPHPRRHRAVRL
jgi:hypothetical protein